MSRNSKIKHDTFSETNNALLLHSLNLYKSILAHYSRLQSTISNANEETANNSSETLDSLLLDIQKVDSELEERLNNTAIIPDSTKELLKQRTALLETLIKKNTTITNQAESIQSLLRHEISGMSTNRRAIQGYMPVPEKKNIVKNSY